MLVAVQPIHVSLYTVKLSYRRANQFGARQDVSFGRYWLGLDPLGFYQNGLGKRSIIGLVTDHLTINVERYSSIFMSIFYVLLPPKVEGSIECNNSNFCIDFCALLGSCNPANK